MSRDEPSKTSERAARLAEQLRANLRKRKVQAREVAAELPATNDAAQKP